MLLAEHIAFFTYVDRPGVVGTSAASSAMPSVNIAGMQVSRTGEGGEALVVLTVDEAIPAEVVDRIVAGDRRHHRAHRRPRRLTRRPDTDTTSTASEGRS